MIILRQHLDSEHGRDGCRGKTPGNASVLYCSPRPVPHHWRVAGCQGIRMMRTVSDSWNLFLFISRSPPPKVIFTGLCGQRWSNGVTFSLLFSYLKCAQAVSEVSACLNFSAPFHWKNRRSCLPPREYGAPRLFQISLGSRLRSSHAQRTVDEPNIYYHGDVQDRRMWF
jgi:hypothetical protein